MTDVPTVLYRSIKGREAADNVFNGKFWFRSHEYLRQSEGGDVLEGIGSYTHPDGVLRHNVSDQRAIQPAYVMCFSEDREATQKFGGHLFRLKTPAKFRDKIVQRLPCCEGFVSVEWIQIEYSKEGMDVEQDLGPAEAWYRQFSCKPQKYADEKEWRLQIRFLYGLDIYNHTLKFWWRSLGASLELLEYPGLGKQL